MILEWLDQLEFWMSIHPLLYSFLHTVFGGALIGGGLRFYFVGKHISLSQKAETITNHFFGAGKPGIGDPAKLLEQAPRVNPPGESYSNQDYIIKFFRDNATQLGINAQFEQKYREAYEWLQKNPTACAGDYYKVFKDIIPTFEKEEVYGGEIAAPELIRALKDGLEEIRKYMSREPKALEKKINTFEEALIRLLREV